MKSQGGRIFGIFNLDNEIAKLPPDPDTEARHRAETLIKTETIRVVLVTMLAEGQLTEHTSPGPITAQVLSGRISVEVSGETKELGTGDLISVVPGVRVEVTGLEDGAFLLTIAHLSHPPDRGGRDGEES